MGLIQPGLHDHRFRRSSLILAATLFQLPCISIRQSLHERIPHLGHILHMAGSNGSQDDLFRLGHQMSDSLHVMREIRGLATKGMFRMKGHVLA